MAGRLKNALNSARKPPPDPTTLFLIGDEEAPATSEPSRDSLLIQWDAIERNESQPRQNFDEAALQELADSIRQDGQLQPILVRPHPAETSKYQIVMGERRWRACGPKYADLPFVRAVVRRNISDEDSFRLALIENVVREDLNDVDKAHGLVALKESLRKCDTRVTWEDVAQKLGYSREHISRLVSMLRLSPDVQEEVRRGAVSSRQARAIARESDPERRAELIVHAKSGVSSDELSKQAASLSSNRSNITSEAVEESAGSLATERRAGSEKTDEEHLADVRLALHHIEQALDANRTDWRAEKAAEIEAALNELHQKTAPRGLKVLGIML